MNPLVSAIVAVHDGEAFLADALESVAAQDYAPLELIIVDDGSSDRSAEIARSVSDATVVSTPCRGVCAARNLGLSMANGAFVAFLDHDDVWLPRKTSLQAGHLTEHPEVGCVLGRQEIFVEPGHELPAWMGRDPFFGDLDGVPLVSAMFRTERLRGIGGYDVSYTIAEDRDLFVRLRATGCRIEVLSDVVLRRRFHDTNRSHQSHRSGHPLLRSLKEKVDRERATAKEQADV